MWIIIETSAGVKRWKKINDSEQLIDTTENQLVDLTTFNDFKFHRNNSEIVGDIKCNVDLDKNTLYIHLKSKYVPEANDEIIYINLNKCYMMSYDNGVRDISFMRKDADKVVYNSLSNKNNEIYYTLYFYKIKKKHQNIFDKMISQNTERESDFSQYMIPYTTEHHFGEMVLFTEEIHKKLKPNTKYYIMSGPPEISHCYDGKGCLFVMDYDDNKIYDIGNKEVYEDAGDIMYYQIGDAWPIHVITKFRDGFKIPKYGVKAETLKLN